MRILRAKSVHNELYAGKTSMSMFEYTVKPVLKSTSDQKPMLKKPAMINKKKTNTSPSE